jgi:hypothetical protein
VRGSITVPDTKAYDHHQRDGCANVTHGDGDVDRGYPVGVYCVCRRYQAQRLAMFVSERAVANVGSVCLELFAAGGKRH